jgi:hypothetical protein
MSQERRELVCAAPHGLRLGDCIQCPDGRMRVVRVASETTIFIRLPRWYDWIALWWGRHIGAKG